MAITITESAAAHIQRFITKRGRGLGIRLGVRTSGCSGFAYALEFVDEIQPEDSCFESHGVRVFVDPKSLPPLDGAEVDFVREGLKEGFLFRNPNAQAQCGCGESFSL